MDLKEYKITAYADSVAGLPDYPSDAGITAAQLKAVFDGRTDKEIKEKFNALIDELITRLGQVEVDIADEVETHNGIGDAHSALFSPIHERIAEILGDNISIHMELGDKVAVSEFDERMKPVEEKAETNFAEINVLYALLMDKADKEDVYTKEETMTEIEVFVSNELDALYRELDSHSGREDNPHGVTAEQIGALTSDSLNDELGKYIPALENDIGALREDVDALKEQIGYIDTALDEIIAIQQSYIEGDEE